MYTYNVMIFCVQKDPNHLINHTQRLNKMNNVTFDGGKGYNVMRT